MDKVRKTLEKLGLNEKEIKIYLMSLTLGQLPASLLGQRNNIVRSTAQYTCQSLVDKGLMSVTPKGNTFLYAPANPEKLLSLVNKEYDKVEEKFNDTRMIMGDLKAMMNPNAKLPKVTYHSGIDEIMSMLEKHAIIKDDTYEFSAHVEMLNLFPDEIIPYTNKHMKYREGYTNYVIDCIENKNYNNKEPYNNLKFKYYGDSELDIKTHIQVDGDRVALIACHDGIPVGIDIDHIGIAQDLKKIFMQLYNKLED